MAAIISVGRVESSACVLGLLRVLRRRRRVVVVGIRGVVILGTVRHPTCSVHGRHALPSASPGTDASKREEDYKEKDDDDGGQHPATPVIPGAGVAVSAAVVGTIWTATESLGQVGQLINNWCHGLILGCPM